MISTEPDMTLLMEPLTHCSHCRKSEEPHWLFIHPASGCRVCQDCLSYYIAGTIGELGKDEFEGYEFSTGPYKGTYQATCDDWMTVGSTVAECVEAVLIKLRLI